MTLISRAEALARQLHAGQTDKIDLTDPQTMKVLWAAITAMTKEIHAPQDVLSDSDWAHADVIQDALEKTLEAMG